MPRITPVDWKTLVKVFELYGCLYRRKEGSHHILVCPKARRAVVIREYDEIDPDIVKNNRHYHDLPIRSLRPLHVVVFCR